MDSAVPGRQPTESSVSMKFLTSIALIAVCIAGIGRVQAATSASKTNTTQHKATTPKNNAATPKKTRASRKQTSSRRNSTHAWRTGQTQPTSERYKELQEALAKKGYLHGEPTGVWDQSSADALRRFQQDQNLQASGKLDSLSIIALGLGPKYEAPPAKPPVTQP
jgi:peptidoglycan hydrolase-like protein with peptidoglycan-binding domain